MRRNTVELVALQFHGARADLLEARQHIDESCLACAIGADQPGNAPAFHGKCHVGQCFQAFELDADIASDQLQAIGHHLNAFLPANPDACEFSAPARDCKIRNIVPRYRKF
jgi:citrate lyase alpha subunit